MNIERLVVGQLATNCYLAYSSGEAVIIDPGDDGGYVIDKVKDLEVKPVAILATHGHFDHLLAATELKLTFGIPFFLHRKDLPILKRTQKTAKFFTGLEVDPSPEVDGGLKEGQIVEFGKERLRVIETPGHTAGSVSFYSIEKIKNELFFERPRTRRYGGVEKSQSLGSRQARTITNSLNSVVFVGDLLFAGGGRGRTDLAGGDQNLLEESVKKILRLPKKTIIYPGHGEKTTVEKELRYI